MELFRSLLGKMITVRSPTHALDLLLFPWYDIVVISKKHCFLRKNCNSVWFFFFFFLEVVFAGNWHLSEGCIYPCVCGMGCKQSLSCCFPEGATK